MAKNTNVKEVKTSTLNRVEKLSDGTYQLTTREGVVYPCTRWFEKKTNAWHVKLPKDNPTGRTYIRESNFDNKNVYEFEDKTEHRVGLSTGGWRSKMTSEEATKVAEAEALIEAIKAECLKRETPKVEKNSPEWLQMEIERLQRKLEQAKK